MPGFFNQTPPPPKKKPDQAPYILKSKFKTGEPFTVESMINQDFCGVFDSYILFIKTIFKVKFNLFKIWF